MPAPEQDASAISVLPPPEVMHERISGATPAMRHYLETRLAHPECLLFYRMGDFYELFYEDAEEAAACLNITLTRRAKQNGEDIPMCGVPHHSYAPYVNKLIKAGYKVAVCEQLETPEEAKKRGYKAVVRREVVRIVTRGTLIEDELLEQGEANYLLAIASISGRFALAWCDISTGDTFAGPCGADALRQELARLRPKEILLSDKLYKDNAVKAQCASFERELTLRPDNIFDAVRGEERVKAYFGVKTLSGLASFTPAEKAALGALTEYIGLTMCGETAPRLAAPKRYGAARYMQIDRAARESLELVRTRQGEKKGSLLDTLDDTVTAAGARLLASDIAAPLTDAEAINRRLDAVQILANHANLREALRETLRPMPDSERALARLCMGKGGVADLMKMRHALERMRHCAYLLEQSAIDDPGLLICKNAIGGFGDALGECNDALDDNGAVRAGYHPKLDELRELVSDSAGALEALRDKYREITGIKSLKISHNNVLGRFVDVSAAQAQPLLENKDLFIHRQTLANAVRFTTDELRKLESALLTAESDIAVIESGIHARLREAITAAADDIARSAYACARLDVIAAFAHTAAAYDYVRPEVTAGTEFVIEQGRHPIAERMTQEAFTPNDCCLSGDHRLWLITGPNMAGKSTFLRQNALIAVMAHIGAFVPAAKAVIGTVDKLFSRVGAADNLAEGHSTFMVEMTETAAVVNNAGPRSLVIMDEIGRGTSTYDGVSIAWSVIEHVYNVSECRALCATHYHELTELEQRFPGIGCYNMAVKEWDKDIIFLHKVQRGGADRSYGIHVGKIAGLPEHVISRAYKILAKLEPHNDNAAGDRVADIETYRKESDTEKRLVSAARAVAALVGGVDPEALSPREALDIVFKLKERVSGDLRDLSAFAETRMTAAEEEKQEA